eukprot:2777532-Rhodomonas_salina.2
MEAWQYKQYERLREKPLISQAKQKSVEAEAGKHKHEIQALEAIKSKSEAHHRCEIKSNQYSLY